MSEPKVDGKIEPEIAAATLVVAESDPAPDIDAVAATSVEDPERGVPKTASAKLKETDKKTFLTVGYLFWAMILVSGGTTAAVLLSRKKPEPTALPTAAPSMAPTLPACSHDEIMSKLDTICTLEVWDGNVLYYSCVGNVAGQEPLAEIRYEFSTRLGGYEVPERFFGFPEFGENVEFSFSGSGEPCNFDQADDFFETILERRKTPCSDDTISKKLASVFGENNCNTTYEDGYVTQCKLTIDSQIEVSTSYTYSDTGGSYKPESITMTYLEDGADAIIVDSQLSSENCPFHDDTSIIFEKLHARREKPHNDIMTKMDLTFGAKNCYKGEVSWPHPSPDWEGEQGYNFVYDCNKYIEETIEIVYYDGEIGEGFVFKEAWAFYEYRSAGDFLIPFRIRGETRTDGQRNISYKYNLEDTFSSARPHELAPLTTQAAELRREALAALDILEEFMS